MQFVLCHEALHCALSHFSRRQHRVRHRWDLACDYAINPILLDEGLTPPPDIMVLEEYRDMTAEQIYPCLSDNDHSQTLDQHMYDQQIDQQEGSRDHQPDATEPHRTESSNLDGNSQPINVGNSGTDHGKPMESPPMAYPLMEIPPLEVAPAELHRLNERWQRRVASAAQAAIMAGKMSAVLKRFVDEQSIPALPWRSVLANYLNRADRDDYSYARPSSRRGDPAIFPRLRSSATNLVVALDVSGSVSDSEISECIGEINAIKGQLRAHITLMACDTLVISGFPREFLPWEEFCFNGQVAGGGGTDFRPVFDAVGLQDVMPDVLLYFTDGQGNFPDAAPPYPVIWLVKGKTPVPWGQRIQLN
jgi:predicted metal-dependent peptidase